MRNRFKKWLNSEKISFHFSKSKVTIKIYYIFVEFKCFFLSEDRQSLWCWLCDSFVIFQPMEMGAPSMIHQPREFQRLRRRNHCLSLLSIKFFCSPSFRTRNSEFFPFSTPSPEKSSWSPTTHAIFNSLPAACQLSYTIFVYFSNWFMHEIKQTL